jgi:hypothetical protein
MTSAFDMFKTSGAMRLIEDKDLLQGVGLLCIIGTGETGK